MEVFSALNIRHLKVPGRYTSLNFKIPGQVRSEIKLLHDENLFALGSNGK